MPALSKMPTMGRNTVLSNLFWVRLIKNE